MPRRFTREEAENLLPRIAPMLEEIRELKRQHDEHLEAVNALQGTVKTNGHSLDVEMTRSSQGLQQATAALNVLIARVNQLGAEVKDIEMGLIDFRGERGGREVYLCWKLGEERIGWWHELDTGYASREPLD
ncbi:MAG: DUF2203 domain-containing protein [Dehalococcoidia bacterium]